MGLFGAAHGSADQKGPLSKICHTYPTLIKLRKADPKKYTYHMTHPLSSADISIFYRKSAIFVVSGNTGIDCILMYNFYV